MTRSHALLALVPLFAMPFLAACVAGAVTDVATAPVRVTGKAVDMATTSQSEADEKRGRQLRKREERLGKLDRRYRALMRDCDRGDRKACEEANDVREQMDRLRGY